MARTATDYNDLQKELAAIEKATGLYLADENVDRENCGETEGNRCEDYGALYFAACMAAGQRAEEAGRDINSLIGRVIY